MRLAILVLASFVFTGCAGADSTPIARNDNSQLPTQTLESASQIIETAPSGPHPTPPHYEEMFEGAFQFLRANYYSRNPNDIDWSLLDSRFRTRVSQASTQYDFWQVMLDLAREFDDPHTFYLPGPVLSSGYSRFSQHGEEGVGIQTRPIGTEPFLYAWDVCPNSPAAMSGVEKGDAIIRVNGNEANPNPTTIEDYLALHEAFNQLWSASGTEIEITFLSPANNQSQTVILKSTELIECDGWKTEVISANPRIGYVRVPQGHAQGAERELEARLEELGAGGQLGGLIYDVRRSSAGITGMFINGVIGFTESARNGEQVRTLMRPRNADVWMPDIPMVVLIDSGTVSSAEIMAISVQASGRATIIGTESRGGMGQVCFSPLRDGSLIGVRCGIFVLPDGTSMEDKKVHPDIHVEMGRSGLRQTPDPQIDAALHHVVDYLGAGAP